MNLLQVNILNESASLRTGAVSKNFDEEVGITSDDGIFPYLNVELRLNLDGRIVIKTYSNSEEVSKEIKNMDELSSFYEQTLKFKLKALLSTNKELNIVQLQ